MTPQETLYWLDHGDIDRTKFYTAVGYAMGVIETRIPKKVSLENGFVKCNACGKYIRIPIADKYSYCPECGQAIDWSEWDDTTGSN